MFNSVVCNLVLGYMYEYVRVYWQPLAIIDRGCLTASEVLKFDNYCACMASEPLIDKRYGADTTTHHAVRHF